MKTKFMTLMTVATLGIFSAATVMAAGNNDFYTQPPAGSEWEKADTEGTYASYTNGNDYVNIYKYSLEDVKTGIAKCNDTYDACYQTIYSEGNSLYMAVGYAKDADERTDSLYPVLYAHRKGIQVINNLFSGKIFRLCNRF